MTSVARIHWPARITRIGAPRSPGPSITEASVTGSVGNTLGELVRAVDLVAGGKIRTVVDRTLPLGEFQKGIDALQKGQLIGRAVLKP